MRHQGIPCAFLALLAVTDAGRGENGSSAPHPPAAPPQGLAEPEPQLLFEIRSFEVTSIYPGTGMPRYRVACVLSVQSDGEIGEHKHEWYRGTKGSRALLAPRRLKELSDLLLKIVADPSPDGPTLKPGDKCTDLVYLEDGEESLRRYIGEIPRGLLELAEDVRTEVHDQRNLWRLLTKRRIAAQDREPERFREHLLRLKKLGLFEQFLQEGLIPKEFAPSRLSDP